MKKDLILQVCIPFCVKQCSYCSFPFCRYDPRTVNAYRDALLSEIRSYEGELDDHEIRAISIEGGSPALLGADALFRVIGEIRKIFSCSPDLQISLQTMPGDYSRALMEKMRDAGVNLWIIGLQTAQMTEHDLLKRPYKYDAITMVDMAVRTFMPKDLSFDLLVGIPGQTVASLRQSLLRCLYYAPEHMTLYPLRIPSGSELEQQIRAGSLHEHDAETISALMTSAENWLQKRGFEKYTSFDYTRGSCKNLYRVLSLQGCERLGLGYRSSSWLDGVMWRTGHSLQEYIEHSDDFEITMADMARPDEKSLRELLLKQQNAFS